MLRPSKGRKQMTSYSILNNENAKELPYIVFWTRGGKTERARHIGKRGTFATLEEAKTAVYNAEHYGTQNV
jgi:hypothetical protein